MKARQILMRITNILYSNVVISVGKASLAYLLVFVLFFFLEPSRGFFYFPGAGSSTIIFAIGGFPGRSVGTCFQSVAMGLLGVLFGAINFILLAKMAHYPIAQACAFFLIVYFMGLLRLNRPRTHLVFALFCVMLSWNGIYTTLLSPTKTLDVGYLISYLQAYAWGAVIVLCVNIFVFPYLAEQELRKALVNSLENIKEFSSRVDGAYRLQQTKSDVLKTEQLAQAIRGDANLLEVKMSEIILEISYSRWSFSDYAKIVEHIYTIQQCLLNVYASICDSPQDFSNGFRDEFFSEGALESELLEKRTHNFITRIQSQFEACSRLGRKNHPQPVDQSQVETVLKKHAHSSFATSTCSREDPSGHAMDVEKQETDPYLRGIETDGTYQAFAEENGHRENLFAHEMQTNSTALLPPCPARVDHSMRAFRSKFEKLQDDKISRLLRSESIRNNEQPVSPQTPHHQREHASETVSSSQEIDQLTQVEEELESGSLTRLYRRTPPGLCTKTSSSSVFIEEKISLADLQEQQFLKSPRTQYLPNSQDPRLLRRIYSYSHSINRFLEELIELSELMGGADGGKRPRRLQFHLFQALMSKKEFKKSTEILEKPRALTRTEANRKLSLKESVYILRGDKEPDISWDLYECLFRIKSFLRSSKSICAAKSASALIALGILFWLTTTQDFALSYGMNSTVISLFLSINLTMGESWLSCIFQMGGQISGLIYAMVILEIFHGVNGEKYYRLGLLGGLSLLAVPMCYLLHTKPRFFTLSILAINSAGGLVYAEYLNRDRVFDSPLLRMGKGLTSLAVGTLIVLSVQCLILRTSAKRQLKRMITKITQENMAYWVLVHEYVTAKIEPNPQLRISSQAFKQIEKELIRRENKIQRIISKVGPITQFIAAEFLFLKGYDSSEYMKVTRANQSILDQGKQGWIAISMLNSPNLIPKIFLEELKPNLSQALITINQTFYFCTSSLCSRIPLPDQLRKEGEEGFSIIGNRLLLAAFTISKKILRPCNSVQVVKNNDLNRYWLYLSSIVGILEQLSIIQKSIVITLGKLEDDKFHHFA